LNWEEQLWGTGFISLQSMPRCRDYQPLQTLCTNTTPPLPQRLSDKKTTTKSFCHFGSRMHLSACLLSLKTFASNHHFEYLILTVEFLCNAWLCV
jgi:hypothetical protein